MLTTDQTNTLIKIINKVRPDIKSLNQSVLKLHNYANQFSMETHWNRLNKQYNELKNSTETFANSLNSRMSIPMESLQSYYKNGNKQINKIEQITTEISIQLNQTKAHIFNMKLKQEFQNFLYALIKEERKIIAEFTTLGQTLLNQRPNPFMNQSFGNKNTKNNGSSQPIQLDSFGIGKEQIINNLKKQIQDKIKKQYQAKIADLQAKIKHKDQIFIVNSNQRLKERQSQNLQIQYLQKINKTQLQTIKKLQFDINKQNNIFFTLNDQQDRLKVSSQKFKEQIVQLKKKLQIVQNERDAIQKKKRELQSKSRQQMQQLLKLEDEGKRIKYTLENIKKEDFKLKQAIDMKTYQLNTKSDEIQVMNTELRKISQFLEIDVNIQLITLIEDMNKLTGSDRANPLKNKQLKTNRTQYISNLSPTKQIQHNMLQIIANLEFLFTNLKTQIVKINKQIDLSKQQLKTQEDKISQHRNQINANKKQLKNQQKQLNLIQQKYTKFVSYESILEANKQQTKKYDQICAKTNEAKLLYEKEKQNVEKVKLQFNEVVKEKFRSSTDIQELHFKIQQLTKENLKTFSEMQAKYQLKLGQEIQKKQKELQSFMQKLSLKQVQLEQMIHEDRMNKTQLLKLTKELQSFKKIGQQQNQRYNQKIAQYQLKLDRLRSQNKSLQTQITQKSAGFNENKSTGYQKNWTEFKENKNVGSYQRNSPFEEQKNDFRREDKQKYTKKTPKCEKQRQYKQQKDYSFGMDYKRSCLETNKKEQLKAEIKLNNLMDEMQEIKNKIFQLNREKTQIKDQNHELAVRLKGTRSEEQSEKCQQKIEELECEYEEKCQIIKYFERELKKMEEEIVKVKNSSKREN